MQQWCRHAGRAQFRHDMVEQRQLALRIGAVLGAAVGDRQMRPDALEPQGRLLQHGGGNGVQVGGRRTDPVHAGVDFDVHRHWPARRCGGRAERSDALGGVQRGREPVRQRSRGGGGIALAEQQHGSGQAVLTQLHALVDQRHGQPAGAAGQRGPGHRRPSMAVPVRLDHRAQLGRRGQAGQHRRVVRHGGQVDLGPRRARAALGHRHRGVIVDRDRRRQPHRRAVSHDGPRSPRPAP